MSDELVLGIFKELAVMEGSRKPDGSWTVNDQEAFKRLLRRAGRLAQSAKGGDETEA
ncbi:hypothetical protein LCL97_21765 [Seohaeicola saemankumensis]|nr:hypothetical protein [Seohaeicola saemankumensis]MCA0873467.1 hypothetical protein [Seohaeicola saemankumensis]